MREMEKDHSEQSPRKSNWKLGQVRFINLVLSCGFLSLVEDHKKKKKRNETIPSQKHNELG